MARRKQPVSTIDQFAEHINDHVEAMAPVLAERLGPAPGSDRYTQTEVDALWDTQDQSVDHEALFQALRQGITPDGAQAVALFRMAPELMQSVVGTPQPPDQAAVIAKLAEYPGRYVLTAGHSPDADLQVKYVEDQHKRAAKRQQQTADVRATVPMTMPREGAPYA